MRRPLLETSLQSEDVPCEAWVSVDSMVDGLAMGGTRMTPEVTLQEVRDLARGMTEKLTLVGLPIGGAKAGIRDIGDDRSATIEAFGELAAPLMNGGIHLGCDLGIGVAERTLFFRSARYEPTRGRKATRLRSDWTTFWNHLVDVTGHGVTTAVSTAASTDSMIADRVVVQGFGVVGRAAARLLSGRGSRVVAVADRAGTISHQGGLDIAGLERITSPLGLIDRGKIPPVYRRDIAWEDIACDTLVLAANPGAVDRDVLSRLDCKLVVEGGNLCVEPGCRSALRGLGIGYVPDVVANVGGAAAGGLILTGTLPEDLPTRDQVAWIFDFVARRVAANTRKVLEAHGDRDPLETLLRDSRAAV